MRKGKIDCPEVSNIRTIYVLENPPNPAGAYPGCWWIISFDGDGKVIEDSKGYGVGTGEFDWNEKDKMEEFVADLEKRTGIKAERRINKRPAVGINGLLNIFRRN